MYIIIVSAKNYHLLFLFNLYLQILSLTELHWILLSEQYEIIVLRAVGSLISPLTLMVVLLMPYS